MDENFFRDERVYILKKVGQERDPRIEKWDDLATFSYGTDFEFEDGMLNKYVDSNFQVTEDWKQLLKDIMEYKGKKDESIMLVQRATFPRGYLMAFQPHSLFITPPAVSKSTFYRWAGFLLDRATQKSWIGTARWTDDKALGVVNQQYYPIALDQIESQSSENVLGYLLGFLEDGMATTSAGGTTVEAVGACPFAITANPFLEANETNHATNMRNVLAFLAYNTYAMGRRFGLIAFGNYKPMQDFGYDDIEHQKVIHTYRILEERVTATLQRFWFNPVVKEYCRKKVYEGTNIEEKIEACDIIEVRSFLRAHVDHSYPHMRGGAINCAIMDNLPKLAVFDVLKLGDFDKLVSGILQEADIYLEKLKAVDLASIEYALA
jgi:hypothetical protein